MLRDRLPKRFNAPLQHFKSLVDLNFELSKYKSSNRHKASNNEHKAKDTQKKWATETYILWPKLKRVHAKLS